MNNREYWKDIDSRLEELLDTGYVKLPSLANFDLDFLASDISNEMGALTFKELGLSHKKFLDDLLSEIGDNWTSAVSSDDKTRATQMLQKVGSTELRLAYDLDIAKAKEWDLFISKGRGKTSVGVDELDFFPEPGLFLIKPDKTIFSAYIQSMPFARPQFEDIINSLNFIIDKKYPARGNIN